MKCPTHQFKLSGAAHSVTVAGSPPAAAPGGGLAQWAAASAQPRRLGSLHWPSGETVWQQGRMISNSQRLGLEGRVRPTSSRTRPSDAWTWSCISRAARPLAHGCVAAPRRRSEDSSLRVLGSVTILKCRPCTSGQGRQVTKLIEFVYTLHLG